MVECEFDDEASEVMKGMPAFHKKPRQKNRKKPRNKDLEINPSLETAIPPFVLEKVQGVKSKKKKRKNKTKKQSACVPAHKKLAIESVKNKFIEVKYSLQSHGVHNFEGTSCDCSIFLLRV